MLTTTAQIDGGVELFYDKLLLVRAKPYLIHDQWAQIRPMPSGHAKIIKFRRYTNLSTKTTILTEGTTPTGDQLAKTDLRAELHQYGSFVHITDVVEITNTNGELHEVTDLLSQQMGETLDEIIRNVLTTCASKTTSSEAGNILSKAEIDGVVKTLLNNSAQFINKVVGATDGVGTTPVRQSFWGTINTLLIDDLETVTDFIPISKYPTSQPMLDSEWGATGNVRWVHSPQAIANVGTANAFVDGTYFWLNIIGKNAYATVDLAGGNAKSIIKPLGSGGTADPLNQRMTMAWKMFTTARILNDNFMHILKVQHSA